MNNELKHYGVLGMKWGVRHDPKYEYTSRLTKKYGKQADEAKAAGDKEREKMLRQKQKRSAELDKRQQAYSERVSTKGNILSRIVTGNAVGGTSYTRILAAMNGQGSGNAGKKAVAAVLAGFGGWPASRAVNYLYVTGALTETPKESARNIYNLKSKIGL